MRGDDTVTRPAREACVQIPVLELHILEMQGLGFSLGRGNRRPRTVDTDHPRVRIAAGVKRRENPRAAAEIENRRGVAKPGCDERSDGRIVVVTLAVEDRQNPWGSRKIVECGLVLRSSVPLFFDMRMQRGDVVCTQGLALPLKICLVAGEPPKPPLVEMDFEIVQ